MVAKVLVIGSGGREHALAWRLSQSPQVEQVIVAPGNAGTHADNITNVSDIDIGNFKELSNWCKSQKVELVVVGPEGPLAKGIADVLNANGVTCFGPSGAAAQIEASKSFAKEFMDKYGIPTARWKSFTDATAAQDFINSADFPALVVKASGLAAGKGVIVAKDKTEACQAVNSILNDKQFGTAGDVVVVEESLEGEEVSCLAFSDGSTIACFPAAQDHKRIYDGDKGPNTGGMGAYCPCPLVSEADFKIIKEDVLQKAIDGLREEGKPFVGVLYAGMMLTKDGPRTLEFNCRFGDPETQVLLPLLKSDLYTIMKSCCCHELSKISVEFHQDVSAVAVALVSDGYPGPYKKGYTIQGINNIKNAEVPAGSLPGGDSDARILVFHAGTSSHDTEVVTSGGRVMATVAVHRTLETAADTARLSAKDLIHFEGKFYRSDIAHKALKTKRKGFSYASAGVSIEAGESFVHAIKPIAKATSRTGCAVDLGMFGGIFDLKAVGYLDPLLVCGTDGVGTKLKIAQECNVHDTVGIDLVAMCVNDILAHGAEPLFFLDYFACGRLDVGVATNVVQGIAEGCKKAGCALIGGETAEMPGMYKDGDYDLAGFTLGAVNRDCYLPRISDIKDGDVVIALASSGIHSNGFSLVRKVVNSLGIKLTDRCPFNQSTLGEALLTPTEIYCKELLPLMTEGRVKGFAHITGGGLPGNVPRILPHSLGVVLDASRWNVHPVFGWLATMGNISAVEMSKTFNCGVGGVLIIDPVEEQTVLSRLTTKASVIGSVVSHLQGESRVRIANLEDALRKSWTSAPLTGLDLQVKVKVGVLISGSGTNLQALIDYCQQDFSSAKIVLVISNKPGVKGLDRAQRAAIPIKVIKHKDYSSREAFDCGLHEALTGTGVELVCLAGFMRILSGGFVHKWKGKMINVHPSLLPSFKGHNAHRQVLDAGVCISGCTVHFVSEEVDAGAILVQEAVPVFPDDTEETLEERVKTKEHIAFPKALELVASGNATLGPNNQIIWKSTLTK